MNDEEVLLKAATSPFQIQRCRDVAERAHEGQMRRDGKPYITHPERVALALQDDPVACCVAWLHDVLEDTDWTDAQLQDAGIDADVVRLVVVITWRWDEDYLDYIRRVKAEPVCRKVKVCDIVDNITDAPSAEQIEKCRNALLLLVE